MRYLHRSICRLLLTVLFLGQLSGAYAGSLESQRQRYSEALQALKQSEWSRFQQLSESLNHYPLFPYLEYAAWLKRLDKLTLATVEDFRIRYSHTPLPDQLHRHWLARLANKRRWQDFLNAWNPTLANDALHCQRRMALLQTDQIDNAFEGLEKLWVVGHSQHPACDPVFKRWLASPYFTPNYAWQRFWLALNNSNRTTARYVRRFIDDPRQKAEMEQALRYFDRPQRLLKLSTAAFAELSSPVKRIALRRLAQKEPNDFLQLWHQRQWRDEHSARLAKSASLRLLRRYDDKAESWARIVDPQQHNAAMSEWRIRNALVTQNWQQVVTLLEKLPAKTRFNDRWRYWHARSLLEQKEQSEQGLRAEEIFKELARKRSFYGFLAADRLGLSYQLNNSSQPASGEELTALTQRADIIRIRELFFHNQLLEARREWWAATQAADKKLHYTLAQLARNWGWYAQGIRSAITARAWDDLVLRFPQAFSDRASHEGQKLGIDPAWIMATIRQESSFVTDARSPAGAMGLMQLMPATAKQTARKAKIRYRNSSELHNPDLNITLGSRYLAQMYQHFEQNRVLASAAYNAGPARVTRWLGERGSLPIDIWIETIPFNETRHYVQNVLSFALIYSDLMGRKKVFMPPVEQHGLGSKLSLAIEQH